MSLFSGMSADKSADASADALAIISPTYESDVLVIISSTVLELCMKMTAQTIPKLPSYFCQTLA